MSNTVITEAKIKNYNQTLKENPGSPVRIWSASRVKNQGEKERLKGLSSEMDAILFLAWIDRYPFK